LLKNLIEANDITFETKDSISTKAIKKKIQGAGGKKSFFKIAADRIDNKFQ
jgi:hypothetical protein